MVMLAQCLPALIERLSWQMDCGNHTWNAPLGSPLPLSTKDCVCAHKHAYTFSVFMNEENRSGRVS